MSERERERERERESVSIKVSAHLGVYIVFTRIYDRKFFFKFINCRMGRNRCCWCSTERVLRKIYEPKTDEITLYCIVRSSPNIIRVIRSRIIRWAGQPACMGKRPLSRCRHRLEDNIKMHLEKIRWGCGLE